MTTGFLVLVGLILLGILALVILPGSRIIPNTRIGIVEKRFSPKGSVKSGAADHAALRSFQPAPNKGHSQRSEEGEKLRSQIRKNIPDKN